SSRVCHVIRHFMWPCAIRDIGIFRSTSDRIVFEKKLTRAPFYQGARVFRFLFLCGAKQGAGKSCTGVVQLP
ncbi:MAG: hypothetical protein ACJAQW_000780, partial [Paracoccaceae bacterium]